MNPNAWDFKSFPEFEGTVDAEALLPPSLLVPAAVLLSVPVLDTSDVFAVVELFFGIGEPAVMLAVGSGAVPKVTVLSPSGPLVALTIVATMAEVFSAALLDGACVKLLPPSTPPLLLVSATVKSKHDSYV